MNPSHPPTRLGMNKPMQASSLYQANEAHAAHVMAVGAETHRPLSLSSQFAVSHAMQRRWLIRKFCKMYWYLPEYSEWPGWWCGAVAGRGRGGPGQARAGTLCPVIPQSVCLAGSDPSGAPSRRSACFCTPLALWSTLRLSPAPFTPLHSISPSPKQRHTLPHRTQT